MFSLLTMDKEMKKIRIMGLTPSKKLIILMVVFISVPSLYYWQRTADNGPNPTEQYLIIRNTSKQTVMKNTNKPSEMRNTKKQSEMRNTTKQSEMRNSSEQTVMRNTPKNSETPDLIRVGSTPINRIDENDDTNTEITPRQTPLFTQRPLLQWTIYTELTRGTQAGEIDPKLTSFLHQNVQEETCSAEFKGSHIIALEKPLGRTGNLLFQVMVLFSVAKTICYSPVLLPAYHEMLRNVIATTGFRYMNNSDIKNKHKCIAKASAKFLPDVFSLSEKYNWTLHGYFQSWKYFTNNERYLRGLIKLRRNNILKAHMFLKSILHDCAENTEITAIHVRRGDFLLKEQYGFKAADKEYIERAMNLVKKQNENSTMKFVFVSNGMSWCKNNFKSNGTFYFSELDSVGADLALISLCDHVIITSGSFGWMGAWLSGKDVIYYKGYPKPNTWFGNMFDHKDYYPSHWIGIY